MKFLVLALFLSLLLIRCSKKDVVAPFYPTDSIGRIDRWLYDSLKRYYYWGDLITANPNFSLSPDAFFKSLLPAQDRFSRVSNGADIL